MKTHQEQTTLERYAKAKDDLEAKISMMDLCSELQQVYKQQEDKALYQKLLNGNVEEDIQRLATLMRRDPTSYLAHQHERISQAFEKFNETEFERFKLIFLIMGPYLFESGGLINDFLVRQYSQIKKITLESKIMKSIPIEDFSLSYLEETDRLVGSFDIEQEIHDLNQELYNVETLREARKLIDDLLDKIYHYRWNTMNRLNEKKFWEPWLDDSMTHLSRQKRDLVSRIVALYTTVDIVKKVLIAISIILVVSFIIFLIFLGVKGFIIYQSYYGTCSTTESNFEKIKTVATKFTITKFHITVYGATDFLRFFSAFLILPVSLSTFLLWYWMEISYWKLIGISNLPTTKAIINFLFWDSVLKLLIIGVYYLSAVVWIIDQVVYNRIAGLCD